MKRILFSLICISLIPATLADVNVPDKNAQLIQSAKDGSLPAVQALLAKGADVNARTKDGGTALMVAAQNGHTEIVSLLLQKGAAVNAKADDGTTALIMAAKNDHTEVVKLLLEKGAKQETGGGSQFKDWGISFTVPAQWQRWSSDKETAVADQTLQSVNDATLKVQLIHLAGWSAADEAAFMLVTITRERNGVALRLSDILARHERDDKRAKDYGDATHIKRLAIDKVGSLSCVVHDVTLRAGGRMLTYDFVSGAEKVQVQWLFRDDARFMELKPAVDGVLDTISIGARQTDGGSVAKKYMVTLLRPAKIGDTYHMQASCRQSERMKIIKAGQEVKTSNVGFSLELKAGVKILKVSTTGCVTKFSLSVINFTKTQGEVKTTLIPKGSLATGYVDDAGIGFTVNGNSVNSETLQALCAVIQLGKGGRWSDDEIYESKEPQEVGNTWKINSAVAVRNLAKTGLKTQADAITGTATLEEITKIEDTPCLKVRGKMHIKEMSAPSIPDFDIETAEMHMAYSATFPVDIAKGRLLEFQEMTMTCSMRGKPDANGLRVLVQSTAERILTTKMDYSK